MDENKENKDCTSPGCSCGCICHRMNGIFISLVGLAFLLNALDLIPSQVVNITWPILLILVGLKKSLGRGMCKCCKHG